MEQKASKYKSFVEAYFAFQGLAHPVKKRGKNPHYKSTFPRYEDIIEQVGDDLQQCELGYMHTSRFDDKGNWFVGSYIAHIPSDQRGPIFEMPCVLGNMQENGKSITYAKRYTLIAAAGLTSEDDDGEADRKRPLSTKMPPEIYTGSLAQKKQIMEWAANKKLSVDQIKDVTLIWSQQKLAFSKDVFDSLTEGL